MLSGVRTETERSTRTASAREIEALGCRPADRERRAMNQRAFVQKRGPAWEKLELLLQRSSRRGLRRLDAGELFELGRLYRWVTSDLAYAQGHGFDAQLLFYLNRLTARAHAQVYSPSSETGRGRIVRFFTRSFPREVRRSFASIGACI